MVRHTWHSHSKHSFTWYKDPSLVPHWLSIMGLQSSWTSPKSLSSPFPCYTHISHGREPWVPLICVGDLRQLLRVPLRSQGHCGFGRGPSLLNWVWCNRRGPHLMENSAHGFWTLMVIGSLAGYFSFSFRYWCSFFPMENSAHWCSFLIQPGFSP